MNATHILSSIFWQSPYYGGGGNWNCVAGCVLESETWSWYCAYACNPSGCEIRRPKTREKPVSAISLSNNPEVSFYGRWTSALDMQVCSVVLSISLFVWEFWQCWWGGLVVWITAVHLRHFAWAALVALYIRYTSESVLYLLMFDTVPAV